jgi:hypothetical protein
MKRIPWLVAVMVGVYAVALPVSAAKKKNYDLYSWPQAGSANYCYSLVPMSKEAQTPAAIKASKDQVCGGRDDLKRIVGQAVPLESTISWKVDAANGFVLPTRDIVNDFKRFAETMPYNVLVAEPK